MMFLADGRNAGPTDPHAEPKGEEEGLGEPEYSDPWQETYYPFCGNGPLSVNSTGDLVTITVSYYFEYFKPNVIFYPYYFTNTSVNSKM